MSIVTNVRSVGNVRAVEITPRVAIFHDCVFGAFLCMSYLNLLFINLYVFYLFSINLCVSVSYLNWLFILSVFYQFVRVCTCVCVCALSVSNML